MSNPAQNPRIEIPDKNVFTEHGESWDEHSSFLISLCEHWPTAVPLILTAWTPFRRDLPTKCALRRLSYKVFQNIKIVHVGEPEIINMSRYTYYWLTQQLYQQWCCQPAGYIGQTHYSHKDRDCRDYLYVRLSLVQKVQNSVTGVLKIYHTRNVYQQRTVKDI